MLFRYKSVRLPPASPGFPSAPLLPTNGRTGHRTTWSGPYDGGAEEEVQGQKGTEECSKYRLREQREYSETKEDKDD